MKSVLYLATYPTENYNPKDLFAQLEAEYTVLHPSFNWEKLSDDVALIAQGSQIPEPRWDNVISRDMLGLKLSNFLVYDYSSKPGEHFLTAAHIFNKPVIVVSAALETVPVYFAGCVKAILRPSELKKTVLDALMG